MSYSSYYKILDNMRCLRSNINYGVLNFPLYWKNIMMLIGYIVQMLKKIINEYVIILNLRLIIQNYEIRVYYS